MIWLCRNLKAAQALNAALEVRMEQCHLQLRPEKTHVVFNRDGSRCVDYAVFHFDFLGYRFRPRGAKSRAGTPFTGFLPAMSPEATNAIQQTIRLWGFHCWHTVALVDVAREINPVLSGWETYYGRLQRSALHTVFHSLDQYLERWSRFALWALAAHGRQ